MTSQAATLAQIANTAEAKLLDAMPADMRDWYLSLPRDQRVAMAQDAFAHAARELAA